MKTKLILALILSCSVHFLYAQRVCATMEVYNVQVIKDSIFRSNRRAISIMNEHFRIGGAGKELAPLDLTIPVVVHVVYSKEEQKILPKQVQSQIDILNDDFASRNADIGKVPAPFKNLIAPDQGIKFKLAVRDPKGKPTDGIEYIPTTVTGFSTNDNIKFKSLGGADAWPSNQYLNIWVGNLDGGILGYAQFPGGPSATDGVVVTYTAFGVGGSTHAPFNKGRTATHEVGHWLDLYHIWGDDGASCAGSDQVTDTPNQAGPNFQCPPFPHPSCGNQPNGDLFMNYMDYVDDDCMMMFTQGQSSRARATIQNVRNSFFSSSGLIDPKVKLAQTELFLRTY